MKRCEVDVVLMMWYSWESFKFRIEGVIVRFPDFRVVWLLGDRWPRFRMSVYRNRQMNGVGSWVESSKMVWCWNWARMERPPRPGPYWTQEVDNLVMRSDCECILLIRDYVGWNWNRDSHLDMKGCCSLNGSGLWGWALFSFDTRRISGVVGCLIVWQLIWILWIWEVSPNS